MEEAFRQLQRHGTRTPTRIHNRRQYAAYGGALLKLQSIPHQFVEFDPEKLEQDTRYISLQYNSANLLCACGRDREVETMYADDDPRLP